MPDSPRLATLKRKLAARMGSTGKGQPGYEENCKALRAEIARLEAKGKREFDL